MGEVHRHFRERMEAWEEAGISRDQVILDLGIGFGKPVEASWQLLGAGRRFHDIAPATMVSLSRKGFPAEANLAAAEGGIGFLRMHRPGEVSSALKRVTES